VTEPITAEKIAEWRALVDASTPGYCTHPIEEARSHNWACLSCNARVDFQVASPTIVAALLDEVQQLRADMLEIQQVAVQHGDMDIHGRTVRAIGRQKKVQP